ncbi:MAG: hypothetical protein LBP80_10835 [Treponema sp.]|jgi:hypothetical protein|nr:hypothetical protein [Treponema sp.]
MIADLSLPDDPPGEKRNRLLARDITAQRSGTIVEALSYYYEAAKFDPGLAEAASRGSVLSADIAGGNIGQNVRNAWNKTFQEAAAFFKEYPPLELICDLALTQGKIDYTKETAEMFFKAKLIGTTGSKIEAVPKPCAFSAQSISFGPGAAKKSQLEGEGYQRGFNIPGNTADL